MMSRMGEGEGTEIMTVTESEVLEFEMDVDTDAKELSKTQISTPKTEPQPPPPVKAVGLAMMKARMGKVKKNAIPAKNIAAAHSESSKFLESIDYSSECPGGSVASTVKIKRRAASRNIKAIIQQISTSPKDKRASESEGTVVISQNKDVFAMDGSGVKKFEVIEETQEEPSYIESKINIIPLDKCSNCLQPFQDGEQSYANLINGDETLNTSILEALCSIFRIPTLNCENPSASQCEANEQAKLLLFCKVCNQSLTILHSAFNSFLTLVKEGSFLFVELKKLDEDFAKLRRKFGRKQKNVRKSVIQFKEETEEETEEYITGDLSCSSDEDFQASPSDLAAVGLQSSSSGSDDEETYILHNKNEPRKASKRGIFTKKKCRVLEKVTHGPEISINSIQTEAETETYSNLAMHHENFALSEKSDTPRVHFRNEHVRRKEKQRKQSSRNDGQAEAKLRNKRDRIANVNVCSFCDKKFARHDQFLEHLRVHTREKPFLCNICHKAFAGRRGLTYHLMAHSNERKFCCSVCGKRFKRLHHLNDHENNHRDNARAFKCETCGKEFKMKKHLNTHLLIHTDVKEHCEICQKAFTRKDNLRQHVKKVHGKYLPEEFESTLMKPIETIIVSEIPSISTTTSTEIIDTPTIELPAAGLIIESEGTQLETINLDQIVYISL